MWFGSAPGPMMPRPIGRPVSRLELDDAPDHGLAHGEPVLGLAALNDPQSDRPVESSAVEHPLEREWRLHRPGHPDDLIDSDAERSSLVLGVREHSLDLLLVEGPADRADPHCRSPMVLLTVSTIIRLMETNGSSGGRSGATLTFASPRSAGGVQRP